MENRNPRFGISVFRLRPVWVQSNLSKTEIRPGSGKCIAKSKGVHREVESEESLRLTNRNPQEQPSADNLAVKGWGI